MTASESRVTVYAKSTKISSTPVRPGKTYPLSVLDHAMGAHTVHLVFYYRPGPTLTRDRLKDSLSDVLSHYPAVTGRLSREGGDGTWTVKCNDAGVRTLDASVRVPLDEWLETATAVEEAELAPCEPMGADPTIWSPFCIQITEFEDKAFALGLSCHHMHADPNSAILLAKAWGDFHRRSYIVNPPFLHPSGLLPRPTPNTSTRSADFLTLKSKSATVTVATTTTTCKMSSATFRFSEGAIKSCLGDVHAASPDATPFDALAALFWLSIQRAKVDQTGPTALTFCVDFRKLMQAPLPHGFYGNALHFSKLEADLSKEWGQVAGEINRHVAGIEEEEYWSAVEWLASRPSNNWKPFQMYGPELTCVKLDHVFAYGVAFEKDGGRPAHVGFKIGGAEGEGVVVVMPAAEEGGRTVAVTLPEEVLGRVCKDEAILRHGPTVLLKG